MRCAAELLIAVQDRSIGRTDVQNMCTEAVHTGVYIPVAFPQVDLLAYLPAGCSVCHVCIFHAFYFLQGRYFVLAGRGHRLCPGHGLRRNAADAGK